MFKVGEKVRYIGPDSVAYHKGGIYEITIYDTEMEAYGVMSELGEDYYVSEEFLERVK